MLEKLPKIKCKYEGCTFERWDGELVTDDTWRWVQREAGWMWRLQGTSCHVKAVWPPPNWTWRDTSSLWKSRNRGILLEIHTGLDNSLDNIHSTAIRPGDLTSPLRPGMTDQDLQNGIDSWTHWLNQQQEGCHAWMPLVAQLFGPPSLGHATSSPWHFFVNGWGHLAATKPWTSRKGTQRGSENFCLGSP